MLISLPCFSGGPLVVGGVQFGVISWGRNCAQRNFPGVNARVPVFIDWIRQNNRFLKNEKGGNYTFRRE